MIHSKKIESSTRTGALIYVVHGGYDQDLIDRHSDRIIDMNAHISVRFGHAGPRAIASALSTDPSSRREIATLIKEWLSRGKDVLLSYNPRLFQLAPDISFTYHACQVPRTQAYAGVLDFDPDTVNFMMNEVKVERYLINFERFNYLKEK